MKNAFAKVAALIGLAAAVTSVQAAMVSQDLGNFSISYDDSFLHGTFSIDAGQVVFATSYVAQASSDTTSVGVTPDSFGFGSSSPLTLTAKSGMVITGVTETLSGFYAGRAGTDTSMAIAGPALTTTWINGNNSAYLGTGSIVEFPLNKDGSVDRTSEQSNYSYSSTTTFAGTNRVNLQTLEFTLGAMVGGERASAYISATEYRLGVTTATAGVATAVPEPEAMAMLLGGLGVVGFVLRRKS